MYCNYGFFLFIARVKINLHSHRGSIWLKVKVNEWCFGKKEFVVVLDLFTCQMREFVKKAVEINGAICCCCF